MSISASEDLPPGADSKWVEWNCLNRLWTMAGRYKETMMLSVTAEPRYSRWLISYDVPFWTAKDLAVYNDDAKKYVQHWLKYSI